MPIHWEIEPFKLENEIELLRKANKKILFIIPTTIQHRPNDVFGVIIRYAIIFEDENKTS
jgi:hypothetical protein